MANERSTTHRRFFRFRLRTLLLLPVLFALGWWWVTWPERTARLFVDLLAAGDVEAAKAMTGLPAPSDGLWLFAKMDGAGFQLPAVEAASWGDYALSQRNFEIPWSLRSGKGMLGGFVAKRNRISRKPAASQSIFAMYNVKDADPQSIVLILTELFGNNPNSRFIAVPQSRSVLALAPPQVHSQINSIIAALDIAPTRDAAQPNIFRHPIYTPTDQPLRIRRPTP